MYSEETGLLPPPTLHVHPSPPDPFAPQGMVTCEALMTAQWQGCFLGIPRGVCSWGGTDLACPSSGGVCEGWHLGWGLGGVFQPKCGKNNKTKQKIWGIVIVSESNDWCLSLSTAFPHSLCYLSLEFQLVTY